MCHWWKEVRNAWTFQTSSNTYNYRCYCPLWPPGRSVRREHGLSVHVFYYSKLLNNVNVSLGKKEWTTYSCIEKVFFSAWSFCSWFIYVSLHPSYHYWGPLAFGGYPLGLDLKQIQLSFCFCMTHFQSIQTFPQTLAVQLCSTQ